MAPVDIIRMYSKINKDIKKNRSEHCNYIIFANRSLGWQIVTLMTLRKLGSKNLFIFSLKSERINDRLPRMCSWLNGSCNYTVLFKNQYYIRFTMHLFVFVHNFKSSFSEATKKCIFHVYTSILSLYQQDHDEYATRKIAMRVREQKTYDEFACIDATFNNTGKNLMCLDDIELKTIAIQLQKEYPGFNTERFVYIHDRTPRTKEYSDCTRSTDPKCYLTLLEEIKWKDFSLVIETKSKFLINVAKSLFGMQIIEATEIVSSDNDVQFFLLSKTRKLITQHSGLVWMASAFNTPTLIVDSFPFYLGAGRQDDIVLQKNISYKGELIELKKAISIDESILYAKKLSDIPDGFKITENTQVQLLDAFRGSISDMVKPSFLPIRTNIYRSNSWLFSKGRGMQ